MKQNTLLLERAILGDRDAEEQFLLENMRLVHSLVRRFSACSYETDDLVQLGTIGLLKAIRNFDTSYGVAFSTYAVPMILGEIRRFIRDDSPIKISRSVKETALLAKKYAEQLRQSFGREPTIGEISEISSIPSERLLEALDAVTPLESIDKDTDSDEALPLRERLAAPGAEAQILNKVLLQDMLSTLSGREKQILLLRYFKGKTQAETAEIIGVSQVQISRIEKKVLLNLRANFS